MDVYVVTRSVYGEDTTVDGVAATLEGAKQLAAGSLNYMGDPDDVLELTWTAQVSQSSTPSSPAAVASWESDSPDGQVDYTITRQTVQY